MKKGRAKTSAAAQQRHAPREATIPPIGPWAILPWVVATFVAFGAFVALDQFVLHIPILTSLQGHAPLSPLFAFWMPTWRPEAALFVALAITLIALVPRLLDRRTSDPVFGSGLVAAAVSLPITLFLVRDPLSRLGSQFLILPGEEYFDDARGITSLASFLRHYAELAPQLSLHGRTHPPGFASLLYLVGQLADPSPFAAGIAVLLVFAAGVFVAWRAFAAVVDRRTARIAALLVLATPSLLDFACTSMDAVFFSAACLVLWGAFSALSNHGRWWHAVLTGVALYAASLCSFSAAPVALFVFIYGGLRWWSRRSARIPSQLALTLGAFALASLAFRAATGFDLWHSFEVAQQQNDQLMGAIFGRDLGSVYLPATFGNVAAALIGTGLAVVPLFARSAIPALRTGAARPLVVATCGTWAILCAGGLYTMETERILMFAMPWMAVSAAGALTLSGSAARLVLGVAWAQALAMEVLLFTLW